MAQQQNNFYKINAPAGSGKTYFISKTINDILNNGPFVKILCITYTNRASQVMQERIVSPNVEISTIHSFLNKFLKPFFKNEKVIDYYLEIYKEEIETTLKEETKLIRYKEKFQNICICILNLINENIIIHLTQLKTNFRKSFY